MVTLCRVRSFGSAIPLAAPGLGSAGALEGLEWDPGLTAGLHFLLGTPWGHRGPEKPTPPQGPGPFPQCKGKMSPGCLPETAVLGHGGIKGGNRLSAAARLWGGAGNRRGDSVVGHWAQGGWWCWGQEG